MDCGEHAPGVPPAHRCHWSRKDRAGSKSLASPCAWMRDPDPREGSDGRDRWEQGSRCSGTGRPADSPHAISSLRHPKAHAFIGCSLTGIALPADPLPSGRILSVLRRRKGTGAPMVWVVLWRNAFCPWPASWWPGGQRIPGRLPPIRPGACGAGLACRPHSGQPLPGRARQSQHRRRPATLEGQLVLYAGKSRSGSGSVTASSSWALVGLSARYSTLTDLAGLLDD